MVSHLLILSSAVQTAISVYIYAIGTNNHLGNVSITLQISHQGLFLLLSRTEYSDWLSYIGYQNIKVALGGGVGVLIDQC